MLFGLRFTALKMDMVTRKIPAQAESPEAIAAVDALLGSVGLEHGRRSTRGRPSQAAVVRKSNKAGRAKRAIKPQVVGVPGWERFPWLVHGFSTRSCGESRIYSRDRATGELNLGYSASDSRENVDRNRRQFQQALDAAACELITLQQVHSGLVRGGVLAGSAKPAKGDGMVTQTPGQLLAIQTADCVPILIVDPRNRAVGAFHAGWRGTVKRIVERGVGRMRVDFGSRPQDLLAAIGPAIGPCCYAVGEEVVAEFTSQFAYAQKLFHEVSDSDPVREKYPLLFMTARAPGHSNIGPQIHLDLWEANRRQLLDAGLREKNIWVAAECTSCNNDRYFSYRAEHGFTGRMLSVAGIRR